MILNVNVFKRLSWGRRCGLRSISTWSTYLQQISFPPSGVHCIGAFYILLSYTQHVDISHSIFLRTILTHWISQTFFVSVWWLSWLRSICFRRSFARSPLSTQSSALSRLWVFFVFVFLCLFSCPGQLNRWPCHSLTQSMSELTFYFSVFRALRSCHRHMWHFWQLIRWTRRYRLTNKKTKTLGAI